MFQCLKRLVYQVPDLGEASRWYSKILGKQPDYESPFGVIFNVGDNSLSLVPGNVPFPDDNGRMSVYWEVEDVDAAYQQLIAAGAKPHTELQNVHMIRIAKVFDPFGNVLGLTGKIPNTTDQTVESQPSRTAVGVALCRTLATYDERPELKGPDYLAKLFLTMEGQLPLKNASLRAKFISEFITTRRYGYMIARTAFIDRLFQQAIQEGTPQIVFLGAGYDTRTHRYPELPENITVFELDVPTTQNRKKEILQKANVATPPQLRYVSINFKNDSLKECLCRAGFDITAKTFFIWEGVTYYLDAGAIDATLQFVHDHTPTGSSICFDYMIAKMESVVVSEPYIFWLEKEKLDPFLAQRGFQAREHLDAAAIEHRFLTLPDGTIAEGTMPHFHLVHAVTV